MESQSFDFVLVQLLYGSITAMDTYRLVAVISILICSGVVANHLFVCSVVSKYAAIGGESRPDSWDTEEARLVFFFAGFQICQESRQWILQR